MRGNKYEKSRSEIQWGLFKFNIIWSGAAVAFGVKFKLLEALFLPPVISLMVYLYWFHQGIVIILGSKIPEDKKKGFIEIAMHFSRGLSMLLALIANFVGIPSLSLYYASFSIDTLIEEKALLTGNKLSIIRINTTIDIYDKLMIYAISSLGFIAFLILVWITLEYILKRKIILAQYRIQRK